MSDKTAFDWLAERSVKCLVCPRCKRSVDVPLSDLPCDGDGADVLGCDAEMFALIGSYDEGPAALEYFGCSPHGAPA